MKKNDAIKLVDEKVNELKSTIASLKVNEEISKATRGTQLYARGRERRVLNLVKALCSQIEDIKLNEDDMNTFVLITTLAAERTTTQFTASEGETYLDIMKRYPKRNIKQIEKSLDKLGLKIGDDGKIVKA